MKKIYLFSILFILLENSLQANSSNKKSISDKIDKKISFFEKKPFLPIDFNYSNPGIKSKEYNKLKKNNFNIHAKYKLFEKKPITQNLAFSLPSKFKHNHQTATLKAKNTILKINNLLFFNLNTKFKAIKKHITKYSYIDVCKNFDIQDINVLTLNTKPPEKKATYSEGITFNFSQTLGINFDYQGEPVEKIKLLNGHTKELYFKAVKTGLMVKF